MLIVSLRGVNFRFWSHLLKGVLGKTPLYLAINLSFRVPSLKVTFICLCFKMVSFRGQKELGP